MSAEKLRARSWLTPLSIPLPFRYFFTFKIRKNKKRLSAAATYSKIKKNTPQPYTLLLFSLYSNRTQLAKAIILPLAAERLKGCYKNGKLWEYCECDGSNICIELLRDALTLLPK